MYKHHHFYVRTPFSPTTYITIALRFKPALSCSLKRFEWALTSWPQTPTSWSWTSYSNIYEHEVTKRTIWIIKGIPLYSYSSPHPYPCGSYMSLVEFVSFLDHCLSDCRLSYVMYDVRIHYWHQTFDMFIACISGLKQETSLRLVQRLA